MVQVGGYRLSWVGYSENDGDKTVRLMAKSGFDDGYLEKATSTGVILNAAAVLSAQRSRPEKFVFPRHSQQSSSGPWRDDAVQRGYASNISLPLKDEKRSLGALTIYAREPGAFDDREVELLKELAANLTYGITALRSERNASRRRRSCNGRQPFWKLKATPPSTAFWWWTARAKRSSGTSNFSGCGRSPAHSG